MIFKKQLACCKKCGWCLKHPFFDMYTNHQQWLESSGISEDFFEPLSILLASTPAQPFAPDWLQVFQMTWWDMMRHDDMIQKPAISWRAHQVMNGLQVAKWPKWRASLRIRARFGFCGLQRNGSFSKYQGNWPRPRHWHRCRRGNNQLVLHLKVINFLRLDVSMWCTAGPAPSRST